MRRTFGQQDLELARAIREREPAAQEATRCETDTRRYRRRALAVAVTFESENNFYTGMTGDISEGGVFIASQVLPPVGIEVTIQLYLQDSDQPWLLRGTVRWVRDRRACGPEVSSGFGVQFGFISAEAHAAIAAFVARRRDVLCDA